MSYLDEKQHSHPADTHAHKKGKNLFWKKLDWLAETIKKKKDEPFREATDGSRWNEVIKDEREAERWESQHTTDFNANECAR